MHSEVALTKSQQNIESWKSVVDGAFIVYNGLVVPKYSRNNESEADRLSMEYMTRAGFDPAAAVRLWKRAYEKEGGEPGYMSILSTHPSNKARYEALERQLASVQIDRGTPLSMPASPPCKLERSRQNQAHRKQSLQNPLQRRRDPQKRWFRQHQLRLILNKRLAGTASPHPAPHRE